MLFDEYTWPMKNPNHKPFQHQKDTTVFLLNNKRAFNLSDMGTGKTLSTLWASDILMHNKRIRKVLIVSPLSTMQAVWGREIFQNLPHRKFCIAHGSKDYRIAALKANADFIIINHDGVTIMEDYIIRENFDLIIIDELTAYKNHTSERSKSMCRIAAKCNAVWGLTGEPTPNSPSEAFGQARCINPKNPALPKYFKQFQDLVEYQLTPYIWVPKEKANIEVFKVLQPSIRFDRDKCTDIPPCVKEAIEIPMSNQQKELYAEMARELLIEYEQGLITAANAGVKAMKLLQICAGAVKDDHGGVMLIDDKPRMDYIEQVLEEMGKNRKLVLFSTFRAAIHKLESHFTKKKFKLAAIHGDVSQSKRSEIIRKFQDEDLELIIIQPQSCAHGVTLTAANVSLWHSLIASGEIFNQANARITRIGQERKQFIKMPWGSKAEKRLIGILESKNTTSQNILELFTDL